LLKKVFIFACYELSYITLSWLTVNTFKVKG